ncbi:MAG: hypothetical protein HKN87_04765 [Saprospiraceae bacterium]|nr:hypothetical protein [Saprospiraceae bacterium]
MDFGSVVGQDLIKDSLRDAVQRHRLPHALLFLGKTGHGTLAGALALARYIMCENRSATDACGNCSNCHKSAKLIHPDIHFTYPTLGAKMTSLDFIVQWRQFVLENTYREVQDWFAFNNAENKQGNITALECARVLKNLSLKTFEGNFKIHITWMAEYLAKQANRLLKIIEEPPQNTFFIIIAENQDRILNTIISRCQLVSFPPINDEELIRALQDGMDSLDQQWATQVGFLSSGDMAKALTLVKAPEQVQAGQWLTWMRLVYKGSGIEMKEWADAFAKMDKESQKGFIQYGLFFLREMTLSKLNPSHQVRLLEKEKAALIKLQQLIDLASIQEVIDLVEGLIFHLERNANARILMLDASIQMHYLLRNNIHHVADIKSLSK